MVDLILCTEEDINRVSPRWAPYISSNRIINVNIMNYDALPKIYLIFRDEKVNEVIEWCLNNLTHSFSADYKSWIFENEDDAILFKLRWS